MENRFRFATLCHSIVIGLGVLSAAMPAAFGQDQAADEKKLADVKATDVRDWLKEGLPGGTRVNEELFPKEITLDLAKLQYQPGEEPKLTWGYSVKPGMKVDSADMNDKLKLWLQDLLGQQQELTKLSDDQVKAIVDAAVFQEAAEPAAGDLQKQIAEHQKQLADLLKRLDDLSGKIPEGLKENIEGLVKSDEIVLEAMAQQERLLKAQAEQLARQENQLTSMSRMVKGLESRLKNGGVGAGASGGGPGPNEPAFQAVPTRSYPYLFSPARLEGPVFITTPLLPMRPIR